MSIDFSRLVLKPAVRTFGKPVRVLPKESQPFAEPYDAHGIWTITQVDIVTEDGGILSNRSLKFGIRLEDFPVPPKQGDLIMSRVCDLPLGYWQGTFEPHSNIDLEITDFQPDGQGGATLIMTRVTQVTQLTKAVR